MYVIQRESVRVCVCVCVCEYYTLMSQLYAIFLRVLLLALVFCYPGRMWARCMWSLAHHVLHHQLSNLSFSVCRQHKGHVQTVFRLTTEETSREVTHYHFTGWPDFGTPRTPAGFVELVRCVGGASGGEEGPILVHCSAGLGRSGVFVAVHSSLEVQSKGAGRIDLETTVREMRKQRGGMVQTAEQYRFCFEATAEALDPTLPPIEEEFRPPQGTQFSKPTTSPPPPLVGEAPPLPPRPPQKSVKRETRSTKTSLPSSPPHSQPPLSVEEERMKRVSSPPPPSSSPPPPLTPPTSESQEDTPTKYPFPETSPEATPTKQSPREIPDILVTPPTRHQSLSSINQDFGSVDRKLVQKEMSSFERGGRAKKSDSNSQQPTATPEAPMKPPAGETGNTSKMKAKPPPQRPQNVGATGASPLPQKEAAAVSSNEGEKKEQKMTEEELKETLSGFEVPPPGKDEVVPQGFEIGDEQTMEAGFPPKMEVMKQPEEKATSRPRWGGGSLLMKKEGVSQAVPSSVGKPRKWGQSHSQTPRPVPEPVNRAGTDERMEKVQRVGKLVIPTIFGSAGATPPSSPTRPLKKPASPDPQPARLVSEPVKPVSQPAKLDTTTPPVLRMIRKIEAEKKQSPTNQPLVQPAPIPTTLAQPVEQKPVKPVKPEPIKLVKQDSPPPPATSVRALLARFEKNT